MDVEGIAGLQTTSSSCELLLFASMVSSYKQSRKRGSKALGPKDKDGRSGGLEGRGRQASRVQLEQTRHKQAGKQSSKLTNIAAEWRVSWVFDRVWLSWRNQGWLLRMW
mmetsp:Transcript_26391/g.42789  ORF Transcript_26391/g.42789 Transcript_26391/m.42789 type:complete len:109 (+) Transcript_26391:157-483(+)